MLVEIFFSEISIVKKVNNANVAVTAILPVTLAPPEKGNSPTDWQKR
jgi:hypothetical protein